MSQPNVFRITGLITQKQSSMKLALPVDRGAVLYSRYRHVRGSSPLGQAGNVSLSKLRALDNLIERLMRMRSNKPLVKHTADLTDNEIDGLVRDYQKGLHRAIVDSARDLALGGSFGDSAISLDIVA